MSLSLALCDVFLRITSETLGFEKKTHKKCILIPSYQGTCCPHDITIGVDLDHQTEVVFIRFLCCGVTPPISCTVLFGRKLLCTQLLWFPHLMSGESCSPSLRLQYLHQLFRTLLYKENCSCFTYSFIHSFISIWIHRHVFYTVDYNSLLHYLFCSFSCPSSSHWKLFHLAPLFFDILHWFVSENLLIFWAHLVCSLPRRSHFPKNPWFLLWDSGIRNQDWVLVMHLLFTLGPPGRKELKNLSVH